MGTNYYWRDRPCNECGRFSEVHVGKSSAGWSFLFHAYPHELMSADHPDWGHDPKSPFGFSVMSRADWRMVFSRPGELLDESGNKVEDPVMWLDGHTAPDASQIRREENRCIRWSGYEETRWRDAEGFRFQPWEFC